MVFGFLQPRREQIGSWERTSSLTVLGGGSSYVLYAKFESTDPSISGSPGLTAHRRFYGFGDTREEARRDLRDNVGSSTIPSYVSC